MDDDKTAVAGLAPDVLAWVVTNFTIVAPCGIVPLPWERHIYLYLSWLPIYNIIIMRLKNILKVNVIK